MGGTINMRTIILFLLFPSLAFGECTLTQSNVTRAVGTINQVRNITSDVLEYRDGVRQCTVQFEGEMNGTWYHGYGTYRWQNDMPDNVACGNAFEIAKTQLIQSVSENKIEANTELWCDENNDPALKVLKPGQVLEYGQWTPHPIHTNTFWYQGTSCKWFVETNLSGNDMRQWEGIVCETGDKRWVVVDKF